MLSFVWSCCILAVLAFLAHKYLRSKKSLRDQIIVVTGGSSGIGRLMCKLFAQQGARVVIWDLNAKPAEEVCNEIKKDGGRADFFQCDVSKYEMVYSVAEQVKKSIGPVDILVNNAGVVSGRPITELTEQAIQRTYAVNVLAHYWTVKAFLPDMIKRNHGHIVSIASAAGWVGTAKMTDYAGSKFAAIGMAESLRYELMQSGASGVHVTCVAPYYISTGMFEGVQTHPLLGILKPEYVAQEIVDAVRTNKAFLTMPALVNSISLFRLLPQWMFDWVMGFLKLNRCMEHFSGRSVMPAPTATASLPPTSSSSSSMISSTANDSGLQQTKVTDVSQETKKNI
eukprot:TRINITY_DN2516_c0_g1_i1.p1 TRINITY_DN2516_c0_g1~~TRINITY_DN2516_c0_g1_i1.p1  ORF type:complete len:340 (+),score=58.81 TRINITY_DN2516_c0_g1_i1:55-1074(+)